MHKRSPRPCGPILWVGTSTGSSEGWDPMPASDRRLRTFYPSSFLDASPRGAGSRQPLEASLLVEDIQRSGLENLHVKASALGVVIAEREISRSGVGAEIRTDCAAIEF